MRQALLVFAFLTTVFCLSALADTVTLKNGDKLTGRIVKADGKTLTIKTEFAGTVTIDFAAVTQITSDETLNLMLKDGQKVVGKLAAASDSRIEVETADTGKVALAKDAIATLRSKEEEVAYQAEMERLRNPGIMDLWAGAADFGLALTSGNSSTSTLTLGVGAARITPRDKLSVNAFALRASDKRDVIVNGVKKRDSVATANRAGGGIRYDVNISKKLFAFGFGDFDFNEFQLIDFRGVFGGGLGYHALKNERAVLDLFAGGDYNKTYFGADTVNNKPAYNTNSAEALVGQELSYKLSGRSSL